MPASQNTALMVKFVINCMLNIHTQHKFQNAQYQQILFFKLFSMLNLFSYSIQLARVLAFRQQAIFFFSGGADEGAQWE
jgi:hypothetical protein